jgi:chromosomal replication initiation ATPase DnaA
MLARREQAEHYKAVRARLGGAPKLNLVQRVEPPIEETPEQPVKRKRKVESVDEILIAYRGPSLRDILDLVCEEMGVDKVDLLSKRRTMNLTMPRQICSYLAKTTTLRSLPEIGRFLGGRDHTTILHGVRKIERLIEQNDVWYERVSSLKARLTVDRANHMFWGS